MKIVQISLSAFDMCRLAPDLPVLVGVSGGPDSLCLLDVLSRLHLPLIVAHFDHALRPESGREAERVASIADRMNLPFISQRQNAAEYADSQRLSLEDAARTLRYHFMFEQARAYQAQAVAVGHHADDQVETVLMHLLRGSGLSGLKGMAYRSILPVWDPSIPLVRPLLSLWRQEILAYCREHDLQPVFDESNQDTAFYRNRVRHELIPLLESYNPQIRQAIWRTAQVLEGDDAVVQAAAHSAREECLVEAGPDHVALRLECLQPLMPGLLRGVLRRSIAELLPEPQEFDFAAVERAVHFVRKPGAGQIDLVQGLVLFRETGENGVHRLVVARAHKIPSNAGWIQISVEDEQALRIPGEIRLSGGWSLQSAWVELDSAHSQQSPWQSGDRWEAWLDSATLPDELILRRPQAGDRFQPLGLQGRSLKLSDFWINEKLPRRARAAWPLVTAEEKIIWVPGYRPADPYQITHSTRKALYLKLSRID